MSAAASAAHSSNTERASAFRIKPGTFWANAMKVSGALGAVGLALAAFGFINDSHRFAFSYLFAFLVAMTIGMGAIFFVLAQHLTGSGWSVTVRRTAEFYMTGLLIMPLLFVPVAMSFKTLYPWIAESHGTEHAAAHGEEHAAPAHAEEHAAAGHGDHAAQDNHVGEDHMLVPDGALWDGNTEALHHEHEHILTSKKSWYLRLDFAGLRAVLYFAAWIFLAWRLFSLSTEQDKTGGVTNTQKLQAMSPAAIALFALSLTFAGFDWIMSLEPTWYSTIFGVYLFAGSAVTIFALVIVTTLSFKNAGLIGNTVTTEHYHDLGKLMFGFIVFWAYIGFSQFMLIWYASIPEETTYYHLRWETSGWRAVSLFLLFAHFVFPFVLVLSRNVKRKLPLLGFAASWMLVMHIVDCYWLVMPYAAEFSPQWLDIACLLGVVGAYLTVVFHFMGKHSLVAVGDPRIGRAMRHHQ